MWNSSPWHHVHLRPLLQLGCSLIKCGTCLQFNVKRVHISKNSCNKWKDHAIHPFCSCILCIWTFLLFYNHCSCENNVIVIPSTMGTCQGDPLGGALFALTHFKALHSIANHFPPCLFPSITYDNHIIGSPSIISFVNEHF